MKKIILIFALALAFLLPFSLWAATPGTVTQTAYATSNPNIFYIDFVCVGGSEGTIPDTATNTANTALIAAMYLYSVEVWPTSGGTAPDAADVQICDANGMDLLGAKGTNLIHATATQDTLPYSAFMAAYRSPIITGALTLKVANETTNGADYTIRLKFIR